jgi:AcrR family transcriptional regulator
MPRRSPTAVASDFVVSASSASARRPLRRDAERNRQRLLAAAGELFAARGLAVTLDDVAHHAGLGVGTVYRRFPSKEALVEALFEERLDEIVALAEQAAGSADSWQGLASFLTGTAELHAADRGMREVLFATGYGRERVAKVRAHLTEPVTSLVARAQADGHLRADIRPQDVPILQLMIGAVAEYAVEVDPELWRRYLTVLLDGLRADGARSELPRPALDHHDLDSAMRCWQPWRR